MPDPIARLDEAVSLLRERLAEVIAATAMPDGPSPTLGQFIRERREALGLSLEDVAQRSGSSKAHIWELEQDRSRNPTVAMVYGLSQALSVPFTLTAAAALATVMAVKAAGE